MPLWRSTIAGILLLGLILRKSSANCSSLVMSMECARYGISISSSMMEAFWPLGVPQVYKSIIGASSACGFEKEADFRMRAAIRVMLAHPPSARADPINIQTGAER